MSCVGKVYLVGAGPGDPGLVTLHAVECLRQADVVFYDYLVNTEILEHTPPHAELVCLGRHGLGRIMPQDEINDRLVREARRGRVVVRLKGGDPVLFARGAEEAEILAAAGICCEMIPGITAGLAAGSYAGIPLTHREWSSGVAIVTGQECWDKQAKLDLERLAQFPGTLVIYMGVTTAPRWSRALIAAGKSAETPAAVVRRCTWPDQKLTLCKLGQISDVVASQKIRPPVIVILGEVVRQADAFEWFSARPLFGQTVLITRPAAQAGYIWRRLVLAGASVVLQQAIQICDPPDWRDVDRAIRRLDQYDWLVFSSVNGVEYFMDRIIKTGNDLRCLGGVQLATIGPATAEKLRDYHFQSDLIPDEYRAESLAAALQSQVSKKRCLLVRASRGREVLAEELTTAGAEVDQVVAYTSTDVSTADEEIFAALKDGNIDWTTVTSSALARSLVKLFGDALNHTKLITISPITSRVLRELGHEPAAEAIEYTMDGVIDAIVGQVTRR